MTAVMLADVDGRDAASPMPPIYFSVRPTALDDMRYVLPSFAEGRKLAPGFASMAWRTYKEHVVPQQREVFSHPETVVLGAYLPSGAIIGWLAYWPRRAVSIVHWVHVRYTLASKPGVPPQPYEGQYFRRRGVMTSLFDAAGLQRIAYTFVGGRSQHDRDGMTSDQRLMPWLQARGHHPVFQPWETVR